MAFNHSGEKFKAFASFAAMSEFIYELEIMFDFAD